jgi:hypothetical protein
MNKYDVAPAANWIKERGPVNFERLNGNSPSEYALVDYQDCIEDGSISRYTHTVERINDESRIEDASLLIQDLNDHQELIYHHITLKRGDAVIDVLDPERFSANNRQRGLESHVEDSITTVSYSIEDLRVGDILDYAYTVTTRAGDHPVYGKYYLSTHWLAWGMPVKNQYIRLLNKTERYVNWSIGRYVDQKQKLEVGEIDPGDTYENALSDLPITQIDRSAPAWFWPDYLSMATKKHWIEISREMSSKFKEMGIWEEDLDISDAVDLDLTDTKSAIIQLLRFVQNEVRYKSESSGIFSHTPKMASKTLSMRHGDCKDKATLLKILLNQIGVEADLVLVNTELEKKVTRLPPSPLWFDHMILRFRYEGREYYVDPTIKKQGGDIHHLADLAYPVALPLCEEGADLVEIPKRNQGRVFELTHTIDFTQEKCDHYIFSIQRIFYGHRADNMRYYLSSKTPELLADEFLSYAHEDLSLSLETKIPIHIKSDDMQSNCLETHEQYKINGLDGNSDNQTLEIRTDHVDSFPQPKSDGYPIKHHLDGTISHKIDVFYRVAGNTVNEGHRIGNKWFNYRDEVRSTNNAYHFQTETVPQNPYISASDLQDYLNDVDAMRQRSVNRFPFRTHQVSWMDRLGEKMWVYSLLLLIVLLVGIKII